MSTRTRLTFSSEFKREAVRMLEQGDKDAAQLARELGIRRNQLYKWKLEIDSYGEAAFPGQGNRPSHRPMIRLPCAQKISACLKEEIEILKKAAIYFARESG